MFTNPDCLSEIHKQGKCRQLQLWIQLRRGHFWLQLKRKNQVSIDILTTVFPPLTSQKRRVDCTSARLTEQPGGRRDMSVSWVIINGQISVLCLSLSGGYRTTFLYNLSGRDIYLVPSGLEWVVRHSGSWGTEDRTWQCTGSLGSSSVRIGTRKVDQMEGGSDLSVKCESELAVSLRQSWWTKIDHILGSLAWN